VVVVVEETHDDPATGKGIANALGIPLEEAT
jgi:hypothetical protein